jgi:hypothetical protein
VEGEHSCTILGSPRLKPGAKNAEASFGGYQGGGLLIGFHIRFNRPKGLMLLMVSNVERHRRHIVERNA